MFESQSAFAFCTTAFTFTNGVRGEGAPGTRLGTSPNVLRGGSAIQKGSIAWSHNYLTHSGIKE